MQAKFIDVHAVAYNTDGNYQIKLVDAPPKNVDDYARILEVIDATHQLILWVPEGTPGQMAQNMATHFVPSLRTQNSLT